MCVCVCVCVCVRACVRVYCIVVAVCVLFACIFLQALDRACTTASVQLIQPFTASALRKEWRCIP